MQSQEDVEELMARNGDAPKKLILTLNTVRGICIEARTVLPQESLFLFLLLLNSHQISFSTLPYLLPGFKHIFLLCFTLMTTQRLTLFIFKTFLSVSRRRRSGYMDDFFSIEPSGSIKSCSGLAIENNDDGSCRGINNFSNEEKQPDRHCFILGTDLGTCERPLMLEEKLKQRDDDEQEQGSKRFYRFLDEWPSSKSSVSTSLFI